MWFYSNDRAVSYVPAVSLLVVTAVSAALWGLIYHALMLWPQ
jgi:hypothetical protein